MPSGLPDPQTAGDTALPCRAAGRGEAWASRAVTGPRAAVHSDLSLAPSVDAAGSCRCLNSSSHGPPPPHLSLPRLLQVSDYLTKGTGETWLSPGLLVWRSPGEDNIVTYNAFPRPSATGPARQVCSVNLWTARPTAAPGRTLLQVSVAAVHLLSQHR